MGINNHWRNKQIGNQLLSQEKCCLEFLEQHSNLTWKWYGTTGFFSNYCKNRFKFGNVNDGLIIINYPMRVSPKKFLSFVDSTISDQTEAVYLAVNRFEFVSLNDLNLDYPDDIGESINAIIQKSKYFFRRYYVPIEIDGKHFVGVHGLDIFVYERNY